MARLIVVLVAMLATTAGGARGVAVQAQDATPMAGMAANALFADTMGLPELAVTASDTAYDGLPAEVAAGRYVVSLTYTGEDPFGGSVQFMQLPEGTTVDSLMAMMAPPPAEATPMAAMEMGTPLPTGEEMGTPPAEEAGGEGAPDWYYEVYHAGGIGALPGQTAQVILDLLPGDYIVWAGDPEGAQMPVGLRVAGDMASPMPGMGAMAPTANAIVTEVKTADGFAFDVAGTLAAGANVIEVVNDSDQPHFMGLYGYPEPFTMDQLMAFLTFDPSMGTPAAGMLDESRFIQGAFANVQSAGTTQWVAANLQPGTYALFCFVGDPTKEGLPHAYEGMVEIVQVGEGGTPVA